MMVTEIKELFAEELALLKKIQKYGKGHSQGEQERVEKVKLLRDLCKTCTLSIFTHILLEE